MCRLAQMKTETVELVFISLNFTIILGVSKGGRKLLMTKIRKNSISLQRKNWRFSGWIRNLNTIAILLSSWRCLKEEGSRMRKRWARNTLINGSDLVMYSIQMQDRFSLQLLHTRDKPLPSSAYISTREHQGVAISSRLKNSKFCLVQFFYPYSLLSIG